MIRKHISENYCSCFVKLTTMKKGEKHFFVSINFTVKKNVRKTRDAFLRSIFLFFKLVSVVYRLMNGKICDDAFDKSFNIWMILSYVVLFSNILNHWGTKINLVPLTNAAFDSSSFCKLHIIFLILCISSSLLFSYFHLSSGKFSLFPLFWNLSISSSTFQANTSRWTRKFRVIVWQNADCWHSHADTQYFIFNFFYLNFYFYQFVFKYIIDSF